jgi:hypothetical protein
VRWASSLYCPTTTTSQPASKQAGRQASIIITSLHSNPTSVQQEKKENPPMANNNPSCHEVSQVSFEKRKQIADLDSTLEPPNIGLTSFSTHFSRSNNRQSQDMQEKLLTPYPPLCKRHGAWSTVYSGF